MNPAVGRLGRWGLGTYFTLLVMFLYAPLVVIFVFSFNDSTIPALPLSGFTTRWYDAAFNDPNWSTRSRCPPRSRSATRSSRPRWA